MRSSKKTPLRSPSRRRRAIGAMTAGVVALLVGSVASPSLAQDPGVRYDRKSKKTKTKVKLDTKFKEAKAEEEKRQNRRVEIVITPYS